MGETKWFCENIFLVNFVIFWYKKNCEEKKLFVTKKILNQKLVFFLKERKNLVKKIWQILIGDFFFLVKKVGS